MLRSRIAAAGYLIQIKTCHFHTLYFQQYWFKSYSIQSDFICHWKLLDEYHLLLFFPTGQIRITVSLPSIIVHLLMVRGIITFEHCANSKLALHLNRNERIDGASSYVHHYYYSNQMIITGKGFCDNYRTWQSNKWALKIVRWKIKPFEIHNVNHTKYTVLWYYKRFFCS